MDGDDAPVGRLLSRRQALALLGGAGASLLVACTGGATVTPAPTASPAGGGGAASTAGAPSAPTAPGTTAAAPSCVVRPALTEGPYFVDERLNRSDIRSDPADGSVRPGVPLALAFNLTSVAASGSCTPLAGATVDVWHCDALGVYSDVSDPAFSTKGKQFLRGYQLTDAAGAARFVTIYPGWYQGRTVHIHFKVRSAAAGGKTAEFTSQLFFDDALSDEVFRQPPYAQKGTRGVRNAADGIYRQSGGQLTLAPVRSGDGYAAAFDLGVGA